MKAKTEKSQAQWVHVPSVDRKEPCSEISESSVIGFRNGLLKLIDAEKKYHNTMAGTMIYRCAVDLDHLARILAADSHTSIMEFKAVITPKGISKKNLKKFVKLARAGKLGRWNTVGHKPRAKAK